jgi:hypothetical protein
MTTIDSNPSRRRLHWVGFFISAVYLLGVFVLVYGRWGWLLSASLNDIGDFLAGVFGPLALLWVVLGFLQQGDELRLSSEALMLQAEELRNSVEQQTALVDVSKKQFHAETTRLQGEQQRARETWSEAYFQRLNLLVGDVDTIKGNIQNTPGIPDYELVREWSERLQRLLAWPTAEDVDRIAFALPEAAYGVATAHELLRWSSQVAEHWVAKQFEEYATAPDAERMKDLVAGRLHEALAQLDFAFQAAQAAAHEVRADREAARVARAAAALGRSG